MEMTLRGDYFNGSFTHPGGINSDKLKTSDEEILKLCPGDIKDELWRGFIKYDHIPRVIESAEQGFQTWRKTPLSERMEILKKFQEVAQKRADDIALAIALETGKPLWESKTEAGAVAAKVGVTLTDSLERIKNKTIKEILPQIDGHTVYKPIGPCLVIGPFNFPCHLANGQILAALIAGNSIIFKPSEKTMYSSQLLIECFDEAGFPKGVINFINGTATTTQDILRHPSIKGIYFTGSYDVGKKILESVGTDITKLVALELGGKNTCIIHHDADLDHALPELLRACFLSSGQRCSSTSMVAVHKNIEQQFIDRFIELTKKIIVDHPTKFKETPFMGPLIDEMAVNKYLQALGLGEQNGAEALIAPREIDIEFEGHYVNPTVHYLKEAKKDNPFTQEEIFGPNCTLTPYEDIEQAIQIANISDYGLASSVFTQDKEIYQRVLMEVDSGIINLNRSTVGASSKLPFGGLKHSGNFHPAGVSMIDHTVHTIASLETTDNSSKIDDLVGLKK
ncbi:MAG: hypothetical protein CME62_10955 [Halobacteriovoraceae bacterium]|nr:hypothetical protein [Halobacteriovoraceae bacterium]|tara:strand:+ start:2444 stop:3970 length:1527 start_codon:yes stop_codon:yes gene_type:complete